METKITVSETINTHQSACFDFNYNNFDNQTLLTSHVTVGVLDHITIGNNSHFKVKYSLLSEHRR